MKTRSILAFILLMPHYALAEMYKYQDQNGNWHFTDTPPRNSSTKTEVIEITNDRKAISVSTEITNINLEDLLNTQYSPKTAVESASIAVVGIESKLGTGSGFFINQSGFIITNKHVIKPSPKTDEILENLNKQKSSLDEWQSALKSKKVKLNQYESKIKEREAYIKNNAKNIDPSYVADFEYRSTEFNQIKKRYSDEENQYNEQRKKNSQELSHFSYAVNAAKVANTYKIFIKNQQEYNADLISISTQYDLALLKINVTKTPKLPIGKSQKMSQGERVFAIGSPLGQRDSVTAGVITQIRKNVVITDAQILPGNSGGPLINDAGEVIAINTLKISQTKGSEGFGHSIPIETAIGEFKNFLKTKETNQEIIKNNL